MARSRKVIAIVPKGDGGIANYSRKLFNELSNSEEIELEYSELSSDYIGLDWIKRTMKILNKHYDIIHIQFGLKNLGLLAPLLICLVSFQSKIVITLHEKFEAKKRYIGRTNLHPFVKTAVEKLLYMYDWLIYQFADEIIVHTEEHQTKLNENFGERSTIIPHFIPEPLPVTEENLGKLSKDTVDSLREKNVITTFGRITPKKGYGSIIDVLDEVDGVVYVIAGPKLNKHEDYLKNLKSKIKKRDLEKKVFFTGRLAEEEIPFLFQISDIAALPYENVTQSGSLSYALTYYVPVLTSDIEHFKKLILENKIGESMESEPIGKIEKLLHDKSKYKLEIQRFNKGKELTDVSKKHLNIYQDGLQN